MKKQVIIMAIINKLAIAHCLLPIAFLSSCKKDKPSETPVNFGYNYFPNEVGRYVIYEVDSIAYDDQSHPPDTTRYLLKEIIAAVFTDNSGKPALRIERFRKMYTKGIPYDSLQWTSPKVWYANRTPAAAEKVEENIRYLKLLFPVKKGQEWDGNQYNILGEKRYEVISADEAETINKVHFDSVITIKQSESINPIEYIYEMEKYARNTGLTYKKQDDLHFSSANGMPPYNDTVGYTFTQKIVSYGK